MKFTYAIYQELLSGLDELDDAYGRTAETANARLWVKELAQFWPNLASCEDGVDIFAGRYPVTGNEKPLL